MRYGSLSIDKLQPWAVLNDVDFPIASITANVLDQNGNSKGGGLVAKHAASAGQLLLKVPAGLVTSRNQVEQCMKTDTNLHALMQATVDFAKVGVDLRVLLSSR